MILRCAWAIQGSSGARSAAAGSRIRRSPERLAPLELDCRSCCVIRIVHASAGAHYQGYSDEHGSGLGARFPRVGPRHVWRDDEQHRRGRGRGAGCPGHPVLERSPHDPGPHVHGERRLCRPRVSIRLLRDHHRSGDSRGSGRPGPHRRDHGQRELLLCKCPPKPTVDDTGMVGMAAFLATCDMGLCTSHAQ